MRKEAYTIPQHWAYAATTNNETPLTDVQNRRYVIVKVDTSISKRHEWLLAPSKQPGLNNRDAMFACALQMLDEGTITGSNGKKVTCKNSIIIMTSNLGSSDNDRNNIGFGSQEKTGEDDRALKEFFKPEFRNRLDLVCKFDKLDTLAIKKIVIKFTEDLKKSLQEKHNINLTMTEELIEHLAHVGYDSKMGARPLSRKIDELIRVPLSKKILFEQIKNSTISCSIDKNKDVVFNVATKITAKVNNDGIITVD